MKQLPYKWMVTTATCPLSDLDDPHDMYKQLNEPKDPEKVSQKLIDPPFSMCYICKGKNLEDYKFYYYCYTCELDFHRGCHLFAPEIKHLFHVSHTLTFTSSDPKLGTSNLPSSLIDFCSPDPDFDGSSEDEDENKNEDEDEDLDEYGDQDDSNDDVALSNGSYERCKCCLRALQKICYRCSICNFSLNATCVLKPPSLTISNHKSHEHTLTLFPRRLPLPCDACGKSLDNTYNHVYTCLPCNYMVHSSCVYLPRVIKITRHQHRISHDFSLPPGDFSCGVCRKTVDINYGQYSCKQGCHYAVHSKCATRHDVWDGKDLDGVPEEFEEYLESFVKIDEYTIQHFSHEEHHLKLHKNHSLCNYGENKFCEACCLPVPNSKAFYCCMECDFILDETCANLPRKKHHPLHKHPLTLHPIALKPFDVLSILLLQGMFACNGCFKQSCGFVYECLEKDCKFGPLDVRCASLPDPLIHGCHPQDHPLFFNLTRGRCIGCKSTMCSQYYLECMESKSFLGIKCATLPVLAHYKHDKHPLTLHYGEKGTIKDEYWCEICESKLDAEAWFYTCELCRVTLHVKCLLREDMDMKPYHVLEVEDDDEDIEIDSNDCNSRPLCFQCEKRCEKVLIFFKGEEEYICTWECLLQVLISKKL